MNQQKIMAGPTSVVTAHLVVDGIRVTMNFATKAEEQVLEQAKNMLASTYGRVFPSSGTHLENLMMTHP